MLVYRYKDSGLYIDVASNVLDYFALASGSIWTIIVCQRYVIDKYIRLLSKKIPHDTPRMNDTMPIY